MAELFHTEFAHDSTETNSPHQGRILIVDDDPIVSGMLAASLELHGHQVLEATCGEEALALLAYCSADQLPNVVFLDIDMGLGINGYETCQRLHAQDHCHDLAVIFLSGHDGLKDRLQAYDAGGSDFIAKPFMPEEVLRKAQVAIRHSQRQNQHAGQAQFSFSTAQVALSSLGETGVALKFNRGALACHRYDQLAQLIMESMSAFGLHAHVQLRPPGAVLTWTPQGPATPLEESVIAQSCKMDRIFSFGKRMVINYDSVSVLVTNMPVNDADMCGRIRDHAAMIAEAADLAVANIAVRNEAVQRSQDLSQLARDSRKAVEELRSKVQHLQLDTRSELESMAHCIDGMFVHLGLTNSQEFAINDTVRHAIDQVLKLFANAGELDERFVNIGHALTKASHSHAVMH